MNNQYKYILYTEKKAYTRKIEKILIIYICKYELGTIHIAMFHVYIFRKIKRSIYRYLNLIVRIYYIQNRYVYYQSLVVGNRENLKNKLNYKL